MPPVRRVLLPLVLLPCVLLLTSACATADVTPPTARDPLDDTPADTVPPTPADTVAGRAPNVASRFTLIGGVRLASPYASEGLAVIPDANGLATAVIAGAHAHTHGVHRYSLPTALGTGSDVSTYPIVAPSESWSVAELFPNWVEGQSLRDMTVVPSASGFALAGIGRVFYQTAPRPTTQINVRDVHANGTLGAHREIPVPLPEQEFSGFIKHADASRDLTAIGAGAYDSGQGSVAGLSYAVFTNGAWQRLLTPPPFGDLSSPRLPRDAEYSCPGGASWVCIPPTGDRGVWSTERIGGGGVRYGDTVLFIATLGYGARSYDAQSYTFGDPARDRAVAYFFVHHDSTAVPEFVGYDRWHFAPEGQRVIGVALGRWPGVSEPVLFVTTANAWGEGAGRDAPMLQLFRVSPSR